MKSVKPGRGPSAMGGFSAVIAVIFGIFWTITASSMGAPGLFPLFGILFVIMGIISAIYNFKNATGKNRYSSFDIVDSHEEPDPMNQRFGVDITSDDPGFESDDFRFCPYCGAKLGADFAFCGKCGKQLPDNR